LLKDSAACVTFSIFCDDIDAVLSLFACSVGTERCRLELRDDPEICAMRQDPMRVNGTFTTGKYKKNLCTLYTNAWISAK
jgi:hypothetical protein